jgi:hypothetical protein
MGTLAKLLSSETETMKAQVEQLTGEEVLAAGQLRQGRIPSMIAMLTGTALIEVLRPRRSKSLPKAFTLAVTPSRVVAFACVGVSEDEDGTNYHVVVRSKERGSWPRVAVSIEGFGRERKGEGWLTVGGERVPVCRPNLDGDPETDALVGLLAQAGEAAGAPVDDAVPVAAEPIG